MVRRNVLFAAKQKSASVHRLPRIVKQQRVWSITASERSVVAGVERQVFAITSLGALWLAAMKHSLVSGRAFRIVRSVGVGLMLSLVCLSQISRAAAISELQQTWIRKAERHEKHGWIYLHIEGAPRVRGFQHGYLLAKEIAEGLRVRRRLWEYESGMDWAWLVERAGTLFVTKVDSENLEEIDGIVEGLKAAGVFSSREEQIAYNGTYELLGYWWPHEKEKLNQKSPSPAKQSCSSFIATGRMTADGGVVLGHNTMFGFPEAMANVVVDIVPEKGHRMLMQIFPGWIHSGTDFFITDAGLVGSETTIGGFDGFDPDGVPEFVRMRRATQDAHSIDEWCAIMRKGNNGGYANAWLLGDVNSGEIARLELGLKHVALEKKMDGYFTGSNVAEDLKLLRFETKTSETDIRISSVARRVRWKRLMAANAGRIDLERAKQFEADHYDSYLGKNKAGGRSLCSHGDLDSQLSGRGMPYSPGGTFDSKVVDTSSAKRMTFAARWGSACGRAFNAQEFLARHSQFEWMRDILKDRPSQPWVEFRVGEKK